MPPQPRVPSLYDAALIDVRVVPKTKNFRKKVRVNASKKKSNISNVIDFGFVKDRKGSTSFQPEKMQKDIAYIKDEVIGEMFIKPLFEIKKRQVETKMRI